MTPQRKHKLTIRTPEGVSFSFLLASPVSRLLAAGLDGLCILALAYAAGLISGVIAAISLDGAQAVGIVCFFTASVGYPICTEWFWRGQTVGKRLLRLRVIDQAGLHLTFSQVVIRNLLRMVDILPAFYLLGGITCFLSRKSQRLGDLAAATVVVWAPRIPEPDVARIMGGKYNSFRQHPLAQARLRQKITPEEAMLALDAMLRRDRLEPEARILLFQRLADYFRQRTSFPENATAGLSDEQFVRNTVDVFFNLDASY